VTRVSVPDAVEDSGKIAHALAAAGRRGARITWRLVAFLVVIVVLVVTYANSLRVYFTQQSQIAAAQAQVQANQQTVNDLYDQLQRWQDPAYVEAQARDRLGWVMPGDVGYQVVGTDGKPLGAGASIGSSASAPNTDPSQTWWNRLTGSINAADNPAPVTTPSAEPTITESTPPR